MADTTASTATAAALQLTAAEMTMVQGAVRGKVDHHARLASNATLIQAARDQHAARKTQFEALAAKLAAVTVSVPVSAVAATPAAATPAAAAS